MSLVRTGRWIPICFQRSNRNILLKQTSAIISMTLMSICSSIFVGFERAVTQEVVLRKKRLNETVAGLDTTARHVESRCRRLDSDVGRYDSYRPSLRSVGSALLCCCYLLRSNARFNIRIPKVANQSPAAAAKTTSAIPLAELNWERPTRAGIPKMIENAPKRLREEPTSEPPTRNIAAVISIPNAKLTTVCMMPSGSGKRPTPASAADPSNAHTAPNRNKGARFSTNNPNEKMMPRIPASTSPDWKSTIVVGEVTEGLEICA